MARVELDMCGSYCARPNGYTVKHIIKFYHIYFTYRKEVVLFWFTYRNVFTNQREWENVISSHSLFLKTVLK